MEAYNRLVRHLRSSDDVYPEFAEDLEVLVSPEDILLKCLAKDYSVLLPKLLSIAISGDERSKKAVYRVYETFKTVMFQNPKLRGQSWWKGFETNVVSCLQPKMLKVFQEGNSSWVQTWSFMANLMINSDQVNGSAVNALLKIVETAFKMSKKNPEIVDEAYTCWMELISIFSLHPRVMQSKKLVGLLVKPLATTLQPKTFELKIKTWNMLIEKIGVLHEDCVLTIVKPFIAYMYQKGADSLANFHPKECLSSMDALLDHKNIRNLYSLDLISVLSNCMEFSVDAEQFANFVGKIIEQTKTLDGDDYTNQVQKLVEQIEKYRGKFETDFPFAQLINKIASLVTVQVLEKLIESDLSPKFLFSLVQISEFKNNIFLPCAQEFIKKNKSLEDITETKKGEILGFWDTICSTIILWLPQVDSCTISEDEKDLIFNLIIFPLSTTLWSSAGNKSWISFCESLNKVGIFEERSSQLINFLESQVNSDQIAPHLVLEVIKNWSNIDKSIMKNVVPLLESVSEKLPQDMKHITCVLQLADLTIGIAPRADVFRLLYQKLSISLNNFDQLEQHKLKTSISKLHRKFKSIPESHEGQEEDKVTSPEQPAKVRSSFISQSNFLHRLAKAEEKRTKKTCSMMTLFSDKNPDEKKDDDIPKSLETPEEIGKKVLQESQEKTEAPIQSPVIKKDVDKKPKEVEKENSAAIIYPAQTSPLLVTPNKIRIASQSQLKSATSPQTPLGRKSPKVQAGIKNLTPKRSTPTSCTYFDDNASDYVVVTPKEKKTVLTEHQKEMMSKRRADIPALYQDLSQDTQTQDTSSFLKESNPAESDKEITPENPLEELEKPSDASSVFVKPLKATSAKKLNFADPQATKRSSLRLLANKTNEAPKEVKTAGKLAEGNETVVADVEKTLDKPKTTRKRKSGKEDVSTDTEDSDQSSDQIKKSKSEPKDEAKVVNTRKSEPPACSQNGDKSSPDSDTTEKPSNNIPESPLPSVNRRKSEPAKYTQKKIPVKSSVSDVKRKLTKKKDDVFKESPKAKESDESKVKKTPTRRKQSLIVKTSPKALRRLSLRKSPAVIKPKPSTTKRSTQDSLNPKEETSAKEIQPTPEVENMETESSIISLSPETVSSTSFDKETPLPLDQLCSDKMTVSPKNVSNKDTLSSEGNKIPSEKPLDKEIVSSESPVNNETVSSDCPLNKETIYSETPLIKEAASSEIPLIKEAVSSESLSKETVSSELNKETVSSDSPLNDETVSSESPSSNKTVFSESPSSNKTVSSDSKSVSSEDVEDCLSVSSESPLSVKTVSSESVEDCITVSSGIPEEMEIDTTEIRPETDTDVPQDEDGKNVDNKKRKREESPLVAQETKKAKIMIEENSKTPVKKRFGKPVHKTRFISSYFESFTYKKKEESPKPKVEEVNPPNVEVVNGENAEDKNCDIIEASPELKEKSQSESLTEDKSLTIMRRGVRLLSSVLDEDETAKLHLSSTVDASKKLLTSPSSVLSPGASRAAQMMRMAKESTIITTPTRRKNITPQKYGENWPKGPSEEWVAHIPTPGKSPSKSLLKNVGNRTPNKEREPMGDDQEILTSAQKKKRVSFLDPPVSRGLVYNKETNSGSVHLADIPPGVSPVWVRGEDNDDLTTEEDSIVTSPLSTRSHNSSRHSLDLSDSSTVSDEERIWESQPVANAQQDISPNKSFSALPMLKNCSKPVSEAISELLNCDIVEKQLKMLGVKNVAQLALLTDEELDTLAIEEPKLETLFNTIQKFLERENIGDKQFEEEEMDVFEEPETVQKVENSDSSTQTKTVLSEVKEVQTIQETTDSGTQCQTPNADFSVQTEIKEVWTSQRIAQLLKEDDFLNSLALNFDYDLIVQLVQRKAILNDTPSSD